MDKVEELLRSRKWAKDCLRVNIAQPDQIITCGKEGKMKIALVKSNLLRKDEHELREAIRFIAPERCDEETQVILNHNVQCERHKGSNKEHPWIIFLGEFAGGALCDLQTAWRDVEARIENFESLYGLPFRRNLQDAIRGEKTYLTTRYTIESWTK